MSLELFLDGTAHEQTGRQMEGVGWMKASRLSLVNEISVKLLVGEHLGINLPASVNSLKGIDGSKKLKVSAA